MPIGLELLLTALLVALTCFGREAEEITNKEHWFDLTLAADGSDAGERYGLLAVYKPDSALCASGLRTFSNEVGDRLLDARYMLLAQYDLITRRQQTWYRWSSDYNLEAFLNVTADDLDTECPVVFFFDVVRPTVPIRYKGSLGDLYKWVQAKSRVSVNFVNGLDRDVQVFWHSRNGEDVSNGFLRPAQRGEYYSFLSHLFYAEDAATGEFLMGWDIRRPGTTVIQASSEPTTKLVWSRSIESRDRQDLNVVYSSTWSHSRRHIYNYKIPPLIPRFTETGYVKRPMPEGLCELLKDFYAANKGTARVVEEWDIGATEVNFYPVHTSMVHLSWPIKQQIINIMQPLLEEWCDCDLTFETVYGIREYYNNSILKNHVDRIKTHTVSVILQVEQDIDEDWELEIIDFNGEKRFIKQYPCEMVFYESSKIIHGRPKPIRGRLYASAFLHFKPRDVDSWNFQTTSQNNIETPNEKIPLRPENLMGTPFRGRNPWRRANARDFQTKIKDEL